MGTVSFINPGEISSASKLNANLKAIQDLGTSILDQLSDIQASTVVDYERRLSALTLRQARSAKILPAGTAVQFTLSDWSLINQTDTTATVRTDIQTATLREKRLPSTILVSNTTFSTSIGTVQSLDQKATLYRVTAESAPTATFTMTLRDLAQLSLMTFTLSALASAPDISVDVSADNVVFTAATNVEVVGSTLTAWFPTSPVLYVRLRMTPTHADDLGGNTYTFGITEVTGTSINYATVSDLYFQPVTVSPQSSSWTLIAPSDPGLRYYCRFTGLGFDSGYVEYRPGDVISVPGVSSLQTTTTIDEGGGLLNGPVNGQSSFFGITNSVINGLVYPWSVKVGIFPSGSNTAIPLPVVIAGFNLADPLDIATLIGAHSEGYSAFNNLSRSYAICQSDGVGGTSVFILPQNLGPNGFSPQYKVQWIYGPAEVNIEFFVHISTTDKNKTPVFTGLSLEVN